MLDTIDKILHLMDINNVSAAQLTREAGITNGLITQWKSRKQVPSTKSLSKIAAYFNVSLDWLAGNEQKNKPLTEREKLIEECLDIMNSLPEDYQKAARDHLRSLAKLASKNKKK